MGNCMLPYQELPIHVIFKFLLPDDEKKTKNIVFLELIGRMEKTTEHSRAERSYICGRQNLLI